MEFHLLLAGKDSKDAWAIRSYWAATGRRSQAAPRARLAGCGGATQGASARRAVGAGLGNPPANNDGGYCELAIWQRRASLALYVLEHGQRRPELLLAR